MQAFLKIGLGLLLIIHGIAHYQIYLGWGARSSAESWLLPNVDSATILSVGTTLSTAALIAFFATGVIVFFGLGWWRAVAVIAAVLSLAVIGLFWQPNMILGVAIDVGILVAILWARWPTPQFLGV